MAPQEQLQHVYWIGGGSAAGKSTIARRIAAQQNLRVYATDDAMADHARRSSRDDCPLLHTFMHMDLDERWVNRSPKAMLETFHWFRGEGFSILHRAKWGGSDYGRYLLLPLPIRLPS